MKKVYILLMGLFVQGVVAQSETTLYLIRHAEKADATPDTELSPEGKSRADSWALYFKDIPIDLIYSTPYLRTQNTCLPTAVSKQKEVISYHPKEMDLKKLLAENKGKTILVVGHSNTIPKHINQLLDKEEYHEIDESEFGNLYVIKEKDGVVSHTLTKI